MEIRVLRYFLAVAEEESISRAAVKLHLSQPTLSTQLKAMEDRLGKQLLVRGSKGSKKVTLTDEGKLLRRRAEEIVSLVDKAESEISQAGDAVQGDIYIGTGETDALRFLARAAVDLQRVYPKINYHIISGNADFVTEQLDSGLIDFGIVFGEIDRKKYDALPIPNKDIWGILMRRDSPLAGKKNIAPQDLWDKPLIITDQKNHGKGLKEWFRRDTGKLNIAATYNLLFNASLLVEEGLGYAIGFDKIINLTEESNLCFRPLNPPIEIKMSLVWKTNQLFSKAAEMFLQKIRASLAMKEK